MWSRPATAGVPGPGSGGPLSHTCRMFLLLFGVMKTINRCKIVEIQVHEQTQLLCNKNNSDNRTVRTVGLNLQYIIIFMLFTSSTTPVTVFLQVSVHLFSKCNWISFKFSWNVKKEIFFCVQHRFWRPDILAVRTQDSSLSFRAKYSQADQIKVLQL